jgi:anti-anti-sigma factor
MQNNFFLTIFVPTVVAAALLSPRWSLVTFAVTLAGSVLITGLRAQSFDPAVLGPTVRPDNLLTALVIAFGIAIAGWMAQSAQRTAEQNALRLVEERDRAELQSREIITANAQLNEQIDQQKQLLELVATLETSVVPLADGILFAPIVGHLDSRRAQAITTRLLEESNQQRARMVILDVGGVAVMDTAVAGALLNTARSLRLLGCEVTLSGISANVALTLTQLGIALEDIRTVRSPQEALTQVGQRVLNGKV